MLAQSCHSQLPPKWNGFNELAPTRVDLTNFSAVVGRYCEASNVFEVCGDRRGNA